MMSRLKKSDLKGEVELNGTIVRLYFESITFNMLILLLEINLIYQ